MSGMPQWGMASVIPQRRTIEAIRVAWASIDELLCSLDADEWGRPTCLPGWNVQAIATHIFATEAFLLGMAPPQTIDSSGLDHVRNVIGEMNENWIASYAESSPEEIISIYRDLTSQRGDILAAMSADEWNTIGFTPAGKDIYGRFMRIRVLDCWMHEHDIREALNRPGHESGLAVEVALDEFAAAMGYVVGKLAGVPSGHSVTFDLTGPSGRQIHVVVEDKATTVDTLDGDATATLTMPVVAYTRLCGGRRDADPHLVELSGDTAVGQRVLDHLAYMI